MYIGKNCTKESSVFGFSYSIMKPVEIKRNFDSKASFLYTYSTFSPFYQSKREIEIFQYT